MQKLSTRFPTAFVTGASSGLGAAFVDMLLAEGILVWGTARDETRLSKWTENPRFSPVVLDLHQGDRILETWNQSSKKAGGFSLVVNNAGFGVFGPFSEEPFSTWQNQLLATVINTTHIAYLGFSEMRKKNSGCLVNISSVAVEFPLPFMAGYNVAKAGLSALSESLIFEARGSGVCVVDFRPGDYRTHFNSSMLPSPTAVASNADPRIGRAWKKLESNLAKSPHPTKAAADLLSALRRGESGTVYSGSFFQTQLAPLFSRLAPSHLRRAITARFFGAV